MADTDGADISPHFYKSIFVARAGRDGSRITKITKGSSVGRNDVAEKEDRARAMGQLRSLLYGS
jgi:hypothetical protein